MKQNRFVLAILTGVLLAGIWSLSSRQSVPSQTYKILWFSFLILMPLGLAVVVWMKLRWAAMACVIYGTVGLALDVATAVQALTNDSSATGALLSSGVSGVLNFLLIALGGRSFLDASQGPLPPKSHPPNPPPPSSSATT